VTMGKKGGRARGRRSASIQWEGQGGEAFRRELIVYPKESDRRGEPVVAPSEGTGAVGDTNSLEERGKPARACTYTWKKFFA